MSIKMVIVTEESCPQFGEPGGDPERCHACRVERPQIRQLCLFEAEARRVRALQGAKS